jgi:hypothetical protein
MKTSDEPITRRTTVPSPRGGHRLVWAVVAMLVVAFFAVLVLAGISALGVRRHLLDGRDALDRGKSDLIDGDAAAAQSEFDNAHEAFRAGADGARSIWLSIAGALPVVGNTPDVVRAVAVDGGHRTGRRSDGAGAPDVGGCSDADGSAPGRLRAFGCPGTAGDAASTAARRLVDPRRLACVPGCRRTASLPVRGIESRRASRDRGTDRRLRHPHGGPREVQLLRLPADRIAAPPQRGHCSVPFSGVLGQLGLLPVGSRALGRHEHDAGLSPSRGRALAHVRSRHRRQPRRGRGCRSARPEGADACDGPGRGRFDRDRAHGQEHRPVRLESGVRPVRYGGGAEARAGTGRASRPGRLPCTERRCPSQAACVAPGVRRRTRVGLERRSGDAAGAGADHRRRRVPSPS